MGGWMAGRLRLGLGGDPIKFVVLGCDPTERLGFCWFAGAVVGGLFGTSTAGLLSGGDLGTAGEGRGPAARGANARSGGA
jgi:hypothetical protein